MDTTSYVLLGAVIAGVTELISRLRARDAWGAVTIFCAAVIGLVFGLFHYYGLDAASGLAVGFGAVGALKTVSKIGQGSSPTPNTTVVAPKAPTNGQVG
jgi:uncharacterized membrane protein HdeD (DUF308 family)